MEADFYRSVLGQVLAVSGPLGVRLVEGGRGFLYNCALPASEQRRLEIAAAATLVMGYWKHVLRLSSHLSKVTRWRILVGEVESRTRQSDHGSNRLGEWFSFCRIFARGLTKFQRRVWSGMWEQWTGLLTHLSIRPVHSWLLPFVRMWSFILH